MSHVARTPWAIRLAAGIAAAALGVSGLACSSSPDQPVCGSSPAQPGSAQPAGPATPVGSPQSGGIITLSPSNVWAVTGTNGACLLHWDGRQWAQVPLPGPSDEDVVSLAAASADSIWAVGASTSSAGGDAPLILHWNGKQWSRSYVTPQEAGILNAVAVAGKDDVWAVGGNDSSAGDAATILHLTAGGWQEVPSPATTTLTGLVMTGSSSGWASGPANGPGKGALLRWNGKGWMSAAAALPADGYLTDLTAGPAGQVWGVGYYTVASAPFSMNWNGKTWQTVAVDWPSKAAHRALESVTAAPDGSAWAVGYSSDVEDDQPAVLHWSGKAWTVAWQLKEGAGDLSGIGVSSSADAWSLGYICKAPAPFTACTHHQYLLLHWNGRAWQQSWLPREIPSA
jgi:hypothetical protein